VNAGRTVRTAPGVVLSEHALDVGLAPLFAAHEAQLQRLDKERRDRRNARARAGYEQLLERRHHQQASLV
jgi:hypothetical protein